MQRRIQGLRAALFLSLVIAYPVIAAENENHPAGQVVLDFNDALTTRNMEVAMPLLAKGAVQYHLHPAHPGMAEDQPLTEDMAAMWTTVTALLFATTEAYERRIEIVDVRVDGELAVVWTNTRTETRRTNKEPNKNEFSEMYFLVNKNNTGWRIAGTATNRPVDNVDIG